MRITKLKVNSYKSFYDTEEIEFTEGINLVIGKNNAGKTSLLKMLSGVVKANAYKNNTVMPRPTAREEEYGSIADLYFCASLIKVKELGADKGYKGKSVISQISHYVYESENIQMGQGWHEFIVDDPSPGAMHPGHYHPADIIDVKEFFYKLLQKGINLKTTLPHKSLFLDEKEINTNGNIKVIGFKFDKENNFFINKHVQENVSSEYEISNILHKQFLENTIFKFDVHRTVRAKGPASVNENLTSNGDNLPGVLDRLQADKDVFNEYVENVRFVFPEVKDITIGKNDSDAEILMWMQNSAKRRKDLTITLDNCGTGIGQVMAILYLAIASEEQKVIIIDEPNSFLHPAANRKLIQVLKNYTQHQYIIATHSPEIISRSGADNILFLSLDEEGKTQVKRIDKAKKEDMLGALESVGSHLSDVYGYDNVLWVEGKTEVKCFPKIIEKLLKSSTVRTPVIKVSDTGSLEKKHMDTSLHIYKSLVKGNTLLPEASGFIFDRDFKKDSDITDWIKKGEKIIGAGKFIILERKEYENYLLASEAVCAIVKNLQEKHSMEIDTPSISILEEFIEDVRSEKKYWDNRKPTKTQEQNWKKYIHASVLLKDIFSKYLGTIVPFNKVVHSAQLTDWLIEHKPEELEELREVLGRFYSVRN